MSRFELTFNWFYADSKHIALYSSGRLPVRAPGRRPGLPTNGDGRIRVARLPRADAHPQAIDPSSGAILNWNNKPAADVGVGGRQLVVRLGAPRRAAAARRRSRRRS